MDMMRCKLIVLYMLDAVNGSLSTAQISEYLLEQENMDYFSFQEMMESMRDSGLIDAELSYQRTLFTLTDAGRRTLHYYQQQLPVSLEENILTWLEAHAIDIREQLTVYSDLYKSTDDRYVAVCQLRDRNAVRIVDLNLSLPTKPQAKAVCRQWPEHYKETYEMLMDTLVQ